MGGTSPNVSPDIGGSLNFLAGGGEMGERIRSFDWETTPLGPPQDWPQSLKTSIRIMLMSRQPVWIGWGKDLVYFYNDPYFSIIGGKHPRALGVATREVWYEIWDVIGPMLATAMAGDEGTYVESQRLIMERNGYPEETYYTFSYSPIPDDDGKPGGIFCANSDDTQRVIGQRELALLRDLASRTSKSETPQDACTRAISALDTNPWDLPFAALYLVNEDGNSARLIDTTRIAPGHELAPQTISLDDPFFQFRSTQKGQLPDLLDIEAQSGDLQPSAWLPPPNKALVVSLQAGTESTRGGLLVCGLSPYRLYNDGYSGFLNLVAGQIAAAISDAEAIERDRRRLEAMAELDRAKTAFFTNVSHEFRTPLTLMLGPLEDLLSQDLGVLPERVNLELERVRRNGLRLKKLVNTLLDYSRLEAGRFRAEFRSTDLGTFTAELASAFASAINKANLKYIVDCPSTLGGEDTYVDRDLWEKVVFNLVSNAFKHTFQGEVRVTVKKGLKTVDLTVADTGIGIAQAAQGHLFQRFRRVEGALSRSHEGSGIGLALVQEIVKLHGGEISVDSRTDGPDHGSSFTVKIPLGRRHLLAGQVVEEPGLGQTSAFEELVEESMQFLAEEIQGQVGADSDDEALAVPIRTSGAKVLIADDNSDMRAYMSRLLERTYAVQIVSDGEAALRAIRNSLPDLLITDVMMPGMDGFELVKAIRSDPSVSELPVIMLSARAGEESRIEGLDAGADDYLVKPFSARELIARVDSTVSLSKLRRETSEILRESQNRLQAALASAQTALSAADAERARLRDLFTRAPALICVLKGPDHVFDLANPTWLAAHGRTSDQDLLNRPIREVLPELIGQGFFEALDGVFKTGEPIVGNESQVRLDRRDDGSLDELYMNFVYQPSRNGAGEIDGVLVHAVDVTEQVVSRRELEKLAAQLEEKVQERTAELTQANEQLQGFTYSVAHDLRQQIRRISTNASMVLHDVGDHLDSESQEKLLRMEGGARQLGELVDDLLSYAKNGIATLQPEDVDLSEVVIEIGKNFEHGTLVVGPTPLARVDRAMIRIVLENLVDNAFKYSSRQKAPLVEFGFADGAYFVRDNGIGFDMRFAHKLFLPFERLHTEAGFAGTGIGLANVHRLIEKHGGKITAEGSTDAGATFSFILPEGQVRSSSGIQSAVAT